jgi:hypothetical protein
MGKGKMRQHCVQLGSDALTYDYENRLISYGTTTFVYDGDGGRVKKEKAGGDQSAKFGRLTGPHVVC